MATSPTDIANLALSEIGATLISSIDTDGTTEARACRLHFQQTRDALLRLHRWNFATTRASLSKLDETPPENWQSVWQVPPDCVKVLGVSRGVALLETAAYEIEGRTLLSFEIDALSLIYISNAVPVPEWDALFVEALVYLLASKIAGPVAQSPSMATDMLNKFRSVALPSAETADAREGFLDQSRRLRANSPLVRSRYNF